jgi:acetate kinase
MEHVQALLKELSLFQSFDLAELQRLIEQSRLDTYDPQETIIQLGQPGRFLGIILEGQAEAVITGEQGVRERLNLLRPGDFIGEMSLITGEPTVADVVALERCELLLIPQEVFYASLAVNPDALRVIASTITERLRWRQGDEAAQTRVEDAWQNAPDPYGLRLSTATPMHVLVLDCQSSYLRFSYFSTTQGTAFMRGAIEGIGATRSRLRYASHASSAWTYQGAVDHVQAVEMVAALLTDPDQGVLQDLYELDAIGHKVAHGGEWYSTTAIIDRQVMEHIEENAILPAHNRLNLVAIRASMRLAPGVPQVAVFDTSYHQTMPPQAYLYGLPYALYETDHIRRYGLHGIAHHYAALEAANYMRRDYRACQFVTCYLDDQASLCAIDHGRAVDTSTGLTPLDGLMMGTRCGDLDPSVILHLLQEKGLSVDQVDEMLHGRGGLYGLSGVSGEFDALEEAASAGDHRSIVAIQALCYRIRKTIGAYVSALGGLDACVFTGRIGLSSAWVRSLVCQSLSTMKIASSRPREVTEISDARSPVKILVVPADEARMIARETIRALASQGVAQAVRGRAKEIPVEVSAHHVHLSQEHVEALFGAGYQLTRRTALSQPGQYACEERVNLIGPRGRVERVRILGPVRGQTQVEISRTEEFRLGIRAPIRPSGDLDDTPGITLEGPRGILDIPRGVICAARHIHVPPEDALSLGLKNRDICMIRVEGERRLIFGDVLVRVAPDYRLAMHVDTDEANAASIRTGMLGHLAEVQDSR